MDAARFARSPVGQVVEVDVPAPDGIVRLSAFVPAPLPDSFELASATWHTVIEAARHIGSLDTLTRDLLSDPTLIAGLAIRREAISTSALEGTYAPVVDVLQSEALPQRPRSAAVTEILNFIEAANHGVGRLETLPVCTRLACELHDLLVAGTPSEDYQRGQLRQTQVVIGLQGPASVADARFIPPPAGDALVQGVDDWERWLHRDNEVHPLIRIAASHYQFETLHPFTDGNGRIGRLLAVLQLMESGLLSAPVINLSPYFEIRRDEYFASLEEVSATGAWDQWISLFCTALGSQARESSQRIRALLDWRDQTVARLQQQSLTGAVIDMVPHLLGTPMVTATEVARLLDVSAPTAYSVLRRLVEHGVLEETTGGTYGRTYQAPQIIDILFRRSH